MQRNESESYPGSIILDVWFLAQLTDRWLNEHLAGSEFTADEFGFCSALATTGEHTASELVDLVGIPQTTLSSMTRRLQGRGLLDSVPHAHDGRARVWVLSPAGWEALGRATERFREAHGALLGHVAAATQPITDAVGALESALRTELGVASRHRDPAEVGESATLAFNGPPLGAEDAEEARRYIEWLRFRRAGAARA